MNFQKEIKEIKQEKRQSFAYGSSREVYDSDCGKFVIKSTYFTGNFRSHNRSEAKLWKKTQSFLLNPVVWHSRNFDFIVQPKLKVIKSNSWFESKEERAAEKEISKMLGLKRFYDVEEIGYNFAKKGLKETKNPFMNEFQRLYKLGFSCEDLHLQNWGEDLLGRFVLIDYSTVDY